MRYYIIYGSLYGNIHLGHVMGTLLVVLMELANAPCWKAQA